MSAAAIAEESQSSSMVWVMIGALGLLAIVLALGFGASNFSRNGNTANTPNQMGATAAAPVTPTDPKIESLLKEVGRLSDPKGTALKSAASIEIFRTGLLQVKTKLAASTSLTQQEKLDLGAKVDAALDSLNKIEAAAKGTAAGGAANQKLLADFREQIGQLTPGINKLNGAKGTQKAADAVAFAVAKATENSDGKGPYKYNHSFTFDANGNPTNGIDCSGFISWVLYYNGIFRDLSQRDTSRFWDLGVRKGNGFSVVHTGALSLTDAKAMIAAGTLKPGDIILSGLTTSGQKVIGKNDNPIAHAVFFIGTRGTDTDAIVQSTNSGGKNGVQFGTLSDRLSGHRGQVSMIVRPPYVQ